VRAGDFIYRIKIPLETSRFTKRVQFIATVDIATSVTSQQPATLTVFRLAQNLVTLITSTSVASVFDKSIVAR